jgi:hypothetical protein
VGGSIIADVAVDSFSGTLMALDRDTPAWFDQLDVLVLNTLSVDEPRHRRLRLLRWARRHEPWAAGWEGLLGSLLLGLGVQVLNLCLTR